MYTSPSMAANDDFKRILKAVAREAGWEILNAIAAGPTRFTELERATKVSPRTLSERLKGFAEPGLIGRKAFPEVPPRVEYRLTARGARVRSALSELEAEV